MKIRQWMPTVLAALSLLGSDAVANAQTTFSHRFAPQEGRVSPVEKPYRDEICLNGSWQFAPVALPSGFQQGRMPAPVLPPAPADGWEKTPIRIPSPWNVNAFPDREGRGGDFRCFPSYPQSWNDVQMGWLRRSFNVPANWKGRRLFLHFDAVAGDTQIVVNGVTVGTHRDIFLPFDLDVTDAVKVGASNELLVGVRKMSLFDVQGQYGRRTYQGGSMWGQAIAGIWQDVFLEAVPTVHVADVFVKPSVDRDTLEAEVNVHNDTDQPATVSLSADARTYFFAKSKDIVSAPELRGRMAGTTALRLADATLTVPAHGTATATLAGKVSGKLRLWTPASPALYGLVCRVRSATGSVEDTASTRFGWRQITFQGSKVLLNGEPLVMNGDSWHFMGIPEMTRRYAWAWFRAMKDAHLNAVRLHAEPYPSFFLDVADEEGILVLDEDAIWASDGGPKIDDPAFWADTEPHLRGLILRDRNHPSVFGWSISNELMAVVRGVFHAPKEYQDEVIRYDGIWAGICRELDPTRPWISADGEDDANGVLPTYVVHYGGSDTLKHASQIGKPWGVGEAGPAYYGSPEQIAQQSGDANAYRSFADRMEGVAAVSYQSLADQRKYDASYRSVFNMVWYGLKPLELGMKDTTRPPALTDGVFFPPFVEGVPGVQPERLGPYCTTLNPGYDPHLPLYSRWPLYDAIADANAEPQAPFTPGRPFAATVASASPVAGTIRRVVVLAGANGKLAQALADLGVATSAPADDTPLLFIDGAQPPSGDAVATIQHTLAAGGTVFVWGAAPATLPVLNALLPAPLTLTTRTASSLVTQSDSPLIAGLTPASLYFSELSPPIVLPAGLGGSFVNKAHTLLAANDTDWMRWNRQPETTKTAMVLRSEREAKQSGAALVEWAAGKGRIIVCNLPPVGQTSLATALNRTLLTNLGIALGDGTAQRNTLDANGTLLRALAIGRFGFATAEEAQKASPVEANSGPRIAVGTSVNDRPWLSVNADTNGAFDLKPLRGVNAQQSAVVYVSFWVFSPKALDNLLLDPHLPNLDLTVGGASAGQVWLNAKFVATHSNDDGLLAPTLLLQQGWNHLLVKIVRSPGEVGAGPTLKFQSNQLDYLTQLRGAQEKPQ